MRRLIIPLLGLIVLAAIASFTMTYTVRFTETAVVTTFGSASEQSIRSQPGLYFKLPFPIQSVTKYDKRLRVVEARREQQQTGDEFQVVVESFLTYRVVDPLKFFRAFSNAGSRPIDHFRMAEERVLRDKLRSAMGLTSEYTMSELFDAGGESALPELEAGMLNQVRGAAGGETVAADYGIEVTSVGVSGVLLPEETTRAVIDRMGANRDRLAEQYESEGDAEARKIRTAAESSAETIRVFAERRAKEIVRRGYEDAAPSLAAQQAANPELAVFLRNIDFMKDAMSRRFTLVLSTSDFGLSLFDPAVLDELRMGNVPAPEGVEELSRIYSGATQPATAGVGETTTEVTP